MHLLSSFHLLIEQVFLFLLLCFLLLVTNQIFNHIGLGDVLIALLIIQFLLLHFFFLGVANILLYLFAVRSLIVYDFLTLLFFLGLVQQGYLGFLVDFHLISQLLLVCVFHVSTPLVHDVSCLLSSLLYFFEGARFFGFEQLNSISEKTKIVFSTFPGKFGSYEFLM
tara:strand:- start:301 stop:801 length:501 start_codon:yes stop_codon:yes gene_type:complete